MPKNPSRDVKNLRDYNTTGAKETVIQQAEDGSMIGTKRKENHTPSSPTANHQSKKKDY